jgi:poly(A) polymerase/tRNA nucleotidyltransferase (CCA-adding enzyme)
VETRIDPPAWLTNGPAARVLAALPGARAVGGAVRDTLAGRAVADIDIASPLAPEEASRLLRAAGMKVVPTGIAHGTVTAVANGTPVEVTTLRRDVATDGRHAVVAFDADWREDAARRDFTINAMSLAPDGTLADFFDGRADLLAGRVRFVGDAGLRIAEDFLRALRWFRFQARYGQGVPDAAALAAIRAAVPGLAGLSAERVWSELKRILAAPDPRAALALMEESGVRQAVLPEGADHVALARLVAAGAPENPLLRLAALLPAGIDLAALATRLRLANAELELLAALRGLPPGPGVDDAGLRRMLADTAPDVLAARAWLAQRGSVAPWDALRARLATTPVPKFPLRAADVEIPPGRRLGQALAAMREHWLEHGCLPDRVALRDEAARRIAEGLL